MACLFTAAQHICSPLIEEIHAVLGPMTYVTMGLSIDIPNVDMQPSSMKEGWGVIQPDAWYTDGSAVGHQPEWNAIAVQPLTNTL